MKKLIALSLLLIGAIAQADITLDFQMSSGGDSLQRTCYFDEKIPTCTFEEDGLFFEITVVPHGKYEVLTTIKISVKDLDGKTCILAEPVIRSLWDKEAIVTFSDEMAEITFQVTASKTSKLSVKK